MREEMKRFVLITLFLVLAGLTAFGQSQGVSVNIRFFDQQIYFPETPVVVKVTIENQSGSPFRFRLAEERVFNLDFDVQTMQNVTVPRSAEFIMERTADQPVFFREVTIQPGEEFAFNEPLDRYVEVPGSGLYVVQARFFPELARGMQVGMPDSADGPLVSNRLTLSVRPPVETIEEQARAVVDAQTGEILRREAFPPDEVVRYILRARQRGLWEQFFLYVDVESIYRENPTRERRFLRLSEEQQREQIAEFREQLASERIDEDIVAVPSEFEVIRTTYTPQEGSVIAIQRFPANGFTEIREYTYYLRREDGFWEIYDYTVQNIGAE